MKIERNVDNYMRRYILLLNKYFVNKYIGVINCIDNVSSSMIYDNGKEISI